MLTYSNYVYAQFSFHKSRLFQSIFEMSIESNLVRVSRLVMDYFIQLRCPIYLIGMLYQYLHAVKDFN